MTSLNVLSYNLMLPVRKPIRIYGQEQRSDRVHEAISLLDEEFEVDVVMVNELIPTIYRNTVENRMKEKGFPYHSKPIQDKATVDGGVIVFSKYPIIHQDFELYGSHCAGSDCFAAKGIVYVQVSKDNQVFHMFGTHLQAWTDPDSRAARKEQIRIMHRFMSHQSIPKNEAVLLIGDINVDYFLQSDQLKHLMKLTELEMPEIEEESHAFTVDPLQNVLVGNDDPSQYRTSDYPQGCLSEYLETLVCPCCPEEWIDYVFYSKKHLQPIKSRIRSIPLKVEPFKMEIARGQEIQSQDISDHFPVLARFEFPALPRQEVDVTKELKPLSRVRNSNHFQTTAIIGIVLGLVMVLGLITLFAIYLKNTYLDLSLEKVVEAPMTLMTS